MSNQNDPPCDTCGDRHPETKHDDDCKDSHECICGDNVMGASGYVSVPFDCLLDRDG